MDFEHTSTDGIVCLGLASPLPPPDQGGSVTCWRGGSFRDSPVHPPHQLNSCLGLARERDWPSMSTDAITAVKQRTIGSATAKVVLLILADYADANWSCFVGQERLAAETETSVSTIKRTLRWFEEDGLITRERRHRQNGLRTSDRLTINRDALERLGVTVTPKDREETRGQTERQGVTDDRDKGSLSTETKGQSLTYEPSEEPLEEPSDRKSVV